MGWWARLRQAWTGDRPSIDRGGHAFVPSRSNFVVCAACDRTMEDGDHDGNVTTNLSGFV